LYVFIALLALLLCKQALSALPWRFQISTADINEYRANLKPAVKKAISELEGAAGPSGLGQGGPPEWLIVYLRPPAVEVADKVRGRQGRAGQGRAGGG
jgi:hypothetical protein